MTCTRLTTLILAIFLLALAGPGCDSGGGDGSGTGVDTAEPGDDTAGPSEDGIAPAEDVPFVPGDDTVDPPPEDTLGPNHCGDEPACGPNEECCELVGQMTCVPAGGCQGGPEGCQSDDECAGNQVCCPSQIPGMGGTCAVECDSGLPNCGSDADCADGLNCQDLMGFASVCLDVCETEADCPGPCQPVGALGIELAKVCDCTECPADTQCCTIDLMGFITIDTCMVECIDLGGFLPF